MVEKSSKSDHPVWSLYSEYRTARLNVRYYEEKVKNLQRKNFAMEFLLAATASSGIAGLWLWESVAGGYLWKIIGLFTAFLAISKPLLKFSEKISRISEKLSAYRGLEHEFHKIVILISQYNKYDDKLKEQFSKALDTKGEIINKYPEGHFDQKLREQCEEIVMQELPTKSFLIPEE